MQLTVNGIQTEVNPAPGRSLLQLLQDELRVPGVASDCRQGHCGACTVHVNGEAVRACITPLNSVAGATVHTAAALPACHPFPTAFARQQLNDCARCPTGQMMAAIAILEQHPAATDDELIAALTSHLCGCLRYRDIRQAIREGAGAWRAGHSGG
jgi:isoquinoline 1-oxidoreductase alpha subunit